MTKAMSAVTLIATSTELNVALSDVPRTSSRVISKAMLAAGRLINPPGAPPRASGPALSQSGKFIPQLPSSTVLVK
jgi:hypothetical protein